MIAQKRINRQVTATKVLALLIRFQNEKDGLIWTSQMIAAHTRLDEETAKTAIEWLEGKSYLSYHLGNYIVTDAGLDYYDGAVDRPAVKTSPLAFKNEVLSGVKEVACDDRSLGKRTVPTSIQTPVLPGHEKMHSREPDPETFLRGKQEREQFKRRLMKELSLSEEGLMRALEEDRIRECKGHDKQKHIGIFDRKGKYWHSLCRQCRKIKRCNLPRFKEPEY